jgi:hypothetical protein
LHAPRVVCTGYQISLEDRSSELNEN